MYTKWSTFHLIHSKNIIILGARISEIRISETQITKVQIRDFLLCAGQVPLPVCLHILSAYLIPLHISIPKVTDYRRQ